MVVHRNKILPAVRNMKDFEKLLESSYEYIVLLDSHVGSLQHIVQHAKRRGKKMLLHADLIQGLKNDDYAAEFLCQTIRPAGLISTRSNVIAKTKQNNLIAIQRMFLLDTNALEKSIALMERTRPDYIEVLPGLMPHMIREVHEKTGIPIIAGGLIRTVQEVENAIAGGAVMVTTSRTDLWNHYISER